MLRIRKANRIYSQEMAEHAEFFRNANLATLALQGLRENMVECQYETELEVTADLFRVKKMMRKWRRAYLNVNVAKDSFELSSERFHAPSITDLLAYTKSYDGSKKDTVLCQTLSPKQIKKSKL